MEDDHKLDKIYVTIVVGVIYAEHVFLHLKQKRRENLRAKRLAKNHAPDIRKANNNVPVRQILTQPGQTKQFSECCQNSGFLFNRI